MNFPDFSRQISKIKNLPLPGLSSHYKMAPEVRIKALKEGWGNEKNPKKAAVMALFYPGQHEHTHLLLMLRNSYPGVHSNQISFPGGGVEEADENMQTTALRETYEEVGVPPDQVEVIREITRVYIPPSNFEVSPFIGLYDARAPFRPDRTEVEALIEVPLDDVLDDNKVIVQKLSTSYATNIEVPAFKLNGYVVWGATAMMLSEIKELFKQVL